MFFESFVYCFLCIILSLFSIKQYKKTEKTYILALLSLQIIATVVEIASLVTHTENINIGIKVFIFAFGILFPAGLFVADYLKFNVTEYIDIKKGNLLMKRKKYEKAISTYQKALSQNSNNAETYFKLGLAYNALGDRRTAFDRFARSIELNRNDYKAYYEIVL